jgi:hypothetical protein
MPPLPGSTSPFVTVPVVQSILRCARGRDRNPLGDDVAHQEHGVQVDGPGREGNLVVEECRDTCSMRVGSRLPGRRAGSSPSNRLGSRVADQPCGSRRKNSECVVNAGEQGTTRELRGDGGAHVDLRAPSSAASVTCIAVGDSSTRRRVMVLAGKEATTDHGVQPAPESRRDVDAVAGAGPACRTRPRSGGRRSRCAFPSTPAARGVGPTRRMRQTPTTAAPCDARVGTVQGTRARSRRFDSVVDEERRSMMPSRIIRRPPSSPAAWRAARRCTRG